MNNYKNAYFRDTHVKAQEYALVRYPE